MRRSSREIPWVLPALALAVVAVVALVIASGDETSARQVRVTVPQATNVIAGQELRIAGRRVGRVAEVEPVDRGRAARLTLEVEDVAWPLRQRDVLELRWGGTISYANRYLSVRRGSRRAAAVPDGGSLRAAQVRTNPEFDELLSAFTAPVRRDVKSFLRRGGEALDGEQQAVRGAVRRGAPAVEQADEVLRQLAADGRSLATLVGSTNQVLGAVRAAQPGVGALLDDARTTLKAVASRGQSLDATLRGLAPTLRQTRGLLAKADGTLVRAQDVTQDLAPGIAEARRTARPLRSVLAGLLQTSPPARAALQATREASPFLNDLLGRTEDLAPTLRAVGEEGTRQLECIRPYAPEIVGFFTTWLDFFGHTDKRNHYGRLYVQSTGIPNAAPLTSEEVTKLIPSLKYAFPRAPGMNAGQPWFNEACGVGPDTLDPSKDPEARR